jgi:hypothetical protein
MAKRVIWTANAKKSRRTILALLTKDYAKKISAEINSIVERLSDFEFIEKESDYKKV